MAKSKKPELGKGLRALLSQQEESSHRDANITELAITQIEANPSQPRNQFDQDALEELASSIKTFGLIQPITVRRLDAQQYQLISGERRWRACKLAGLKKVPAYIRTANDQELLEMSLVENIQRTDLNPLEVALSYQRLIDECKLTHEEMSGRIGKKRSTISNYVRLLKLAPVVQKAVRDELISMGHARVIAGLQNVDEQITLLEEVLKKDLSVRQTEAWAKKLKAPGSTLSSNEKNETLDTYLKVQDQLRQHLGSKVNIKVNKNGSGSIQIPFSSTSDFNRLLDIIEE